MAQPALNASSQQALKEIDFLFEQKLAKIRLLKAEISEMNTTIKQAYKNNSKLFTDKAFKEFAVKIGQLRKLLRETEAEVQLLSRAIAFGK